VKAIAGTGIGDGMVVGGVEIDLGLTVYFADVLAERPVFHRARRFPWGSGATERRSVCGHVVIWSALGRAVPITALPPVHAAKIGRPCRHCWPELKTVAAA
jgi:hypothetical protein